MRKILPLLLVACAAAVTTAAEVRVLSEAGCSGAVVLLGDIAEIHANDQARREELAAIELFPTPPQGSLRRLPLRELQELLYLRGFDVSDCRFFGATTTTIVAGQAEPNLLRMPGVEAELRTTAQRRVREAIVSYLEIVAADEGSHIEWQVELSIAPQYVSLFADASKEIVVQGGLAPWQGQQSFEITLLAGMGSAEVSTREFTIDAQVRAMVRVLVAAQSLSRGQQVTAADVQLASYEAGSAPGGLLLTPEEAVGLELSTSVARGRPIREADLRAPRLVQRNDQVQLIVQRGGVVVRTSAKALGEGALGEAIEVQRIGNRERLLARVVGPGLVELGSVTELNR